MSQKPMIVVEKGKLEQDLDGEGVMQRDGSTSLGINFPVLETESSAGAEMGPKSGQDQWSGIGTNQNPGSAPIHFQTDLGDLGFCCSFSITGIYKSWVFPFA